MVAHGRKKGKGRREEKGEVELSSAVPVLFLGPVALVPLLFVPDLSSSKETR